MLKRPVPSPSSAPRPPATPSGWLWWNWQPLSIRSALYGRRTELSTVARRYGPWGGEAGHSQPGKGHHSSREVSSEKILGSSARAKRPPLLPGSPHMTPPPAQKQAALRRLFARPACARGGLIGGEEVGTQSMRPVITPPIRPCRFARFPAGTGIAHWWPAAECCARAGSTTK